MTASASLRGTVGRTRRAIGLSLGNRNGQAVAVSVTILYLLGYLYAIGMVQPGTGAFGVRVARAPAAQLFRQTFGTFTYEPVALFEFGIVTYQFSLNTIIGLAVGILVGVNVAVSYTAWRQPTACGLKSGSAGLVAGIPALLSGAACCAPVVVLLIGIQITGAVLVVFELLLPLSVAMLVGSLLVVSRQVEPTAT